MQRYVFFLYLSQLNRIFSKVHLNNMVNLENEHIPYNTNSSKSNISIRRVP